MITRYDSVLFAECDESYAEMITASDGLYVYYDDHESVVNELVDYIESLRKWISNVATEEQLDQRVPALSQVSGRELLTRVI